MKVSVIIATYKRDAELERAIISVQNQTYKNIEIIVVDDNADAYWNDIVEKIILAFDNIIYIKNAENCGSARSRNYGIFAATGDYITFLDDDDEYLPLKIEKQMDIMLSEYSDYSLTDLWLYNEDGSVNSKRERPLLSGDSKKNLIRYHLMYHLTGTDTMMFKAEYLRKIGGFTEIDVGDEYYLSMKAIQNGGKFSYLHSCYVKAYIHNGEFGGLSSGQKKIDGERALYREKQKHYDCLSRSDIKCVKARHYAVVAYAQYRRRKYGCFLANSIVAFLCSPKHCLRILKDRRSSLPEITS